MGEQEVNYFIPTGDEADRMLRAYGWTPLHSEVKTSSLKTYSDWLSQPLDRPGPVLFNFPFPSGIERLFFYRLSRKGWPCIALLNAQELTPRALSVLKRFDVLIATDEEMALAAGSAGRPVVLVNTSLRKALQEALALVGD